MSSGDEQYPGAEYRAGEYPGGGFLAGGAAEGGGSGAEVLVFPTAALSGPGWSEPVARLVAAVGAVRAQDPSVVAGPRALAEAAVVWAEVEKLTGVGLRRIADVEARQLSVLVGVPSTVGWLLEVGVDRSQLGAARQLARWPVLAARVEAGGLSVASAVKIGQALGRLRPFLDRPDGLIDGQDGALVLPAVIVEGVAMLVGQARGGWPPGSTPAARPRPRRRS